MNEYAAFIITIPERVDSLNIVLKGLALEGIKAKVYTDYDHRGCWWNQSRMFLDVCSHNPNLNVITATDDIIFKDGWLNRVDRLISESDYEIISMFTNQNTIADDDNDFGIRKARYRMWMYDQACVWRAGVLNMEFWDGLVEYAKAPERTKKELGHLDCMMSGYTFDKGYKCCTLRPNAIKLQNVKSTLGHNIVIKDN